MFAQLVVDALLPEARRDPFNGEIPFGYIGVVSEDGTNVRAKKGELEYIEHSELGYTEATGRWRYATNRRPAVILWNAPPTMLQILAVKDWLEERGYKVAGNIQDYAMWRGL